MLLGTVGCYTDTDIADHVQTFQVRWSAPDDQHLSSINEQTSTSNPGNFGIRTNRAVVVITREAQATSKSAVGLWLVAFEPSSHQVPKCLQ